MIDPNRITKDMPVIAADGERIGEVDGVEGAGQDARIKLKRTTSPDGHHHFVPLTDVARVDEHVHLSSAAAQVRAGWMTAGAAVAGAAVGSAAVGTGATGATATATDTPPPTTTTHVNHGAREVHVDKERNWLPWILGSLALLALLVFGLRSCDDRDATPVAPVTDNVVAAAPVDTDVAVAVEEQSVPLPGGGTVMLAPQTIGYDLQRYLASDEASGRRFEFERLNFDTAKADIRAIDRPTVDGIATILVAYPAARVRLIGYADARGDADANANLGIMRARAVAAALAAKGVAADRIDTASGGETGATETNATAQGQADNRRTEMVVLKK